MTKTLLVGSLSAVVMLAAASATLAGSASRPGDSLLMDYKAPAVGFNGWEGRRIAAPAGDEVLGSTPTPAQPWYEGAAGPPDADASRLTGDGGASRLANLTPDAGTDALPLSQFAGEGARSMANHDSLSVWDFLNAVRYGRLPEPASWALILIGFGMIGGALRGFVVANRRLAKLQPEDTEIE